jgi:alpha-mannosidase
MAAPSHSGQLAGMFSAPNVAPAKVTVESPKKAEDTDEFIFRLYETDGKAANALLTFSRSPRSARETDVLEWDKYVQPKSFVIQGMKVNVPVAPHELPAITAGARFQRQSFKGRYALLGCCGKFPCFTPLFLMCPSL